VRHLVEEIAEGVREDPPQARGVLPGRGLGTSAW